MKIDLVLPQSLQGSTKFHEALAHSGGSSKARSIVDALFEIITTRADLSVQQMFLEKTSFDAQGFPVQDVGDIRLVVEIDDECIEAERGCFFDMAFQGSEWIRSGETERDIEAAAAFEVICDILEESIPVGEQQDLLDANLSEEG